MLENVQNKFLQRLRWRCSLTRHDVSLPSIESLLHSQNVRALYQLNRANMIGFFFDVSQNNLRSGCAVKPKATAKTERINNLFSWRMCKCFHNDTEIPTFMRHTQFQQFDDVWSYTEYCLSPKPPLYIVNKGEIYSILYNWVQLTTHCNRAQIQIQTQSIVHFPRYTTDTKGENKRTNIGADVNGNVILRVIQISVVPLRIPPLGLVPSYRTHLSTIC